MTFLQSFDLTTLEWFFIILCTMTIGLSKTGIIGIASVGIPIMAVILGGRASTGFILPMLIMADLFAVSYFRRFADWKLLVKLLPPSFVGVLLGTWFGNQVDDSAFKLAMGAIIVISVIIMIWRDVKKIQTIPDYWWFSVLMGLAAGFTTMVGNLAGAVTALYFLSMRLPKNAFIGTSAWFYLIINSFKVPFHVFSWETISWDSFQFNLLLLPAIALGAFTGFRVVKYISESGYRKFIIAVTLISAFLLLL